MEIILHIHRIIEKEKKVSPEQKHPVIKFYLMEVDVN